MLNKPKFMSPSVNVYDNSVIDLNSDILPFSCIVDGNEAITHWQIVVSKLNDNTIVFDTGKKELESPFYPINNRNQNVVFSVNLKDYFTSADVCYIAADAIYNPENIYYTCVDNVYTKYIYNKTTWNTDYVSLYYTNFINSNEAYYWSITLWGKTGTTTYGAEEVFYANSTPNVSVYYSYDNNFINEDGDLNSELILNEKESNILSSRKVFLKATYVQNEGVSLKRYGWRLTDTSNNVVIIDTITKNQVYGVEDNISCECNGLINKTNYLMELYIETQNGYFNVLKAMKIEVDYVVKSIDADFEVVELNNTSAIMLRWEKLRTTEGVVVGNDVDYTTNFPIVSYDGYGNQNGSVSIEIPKNSSVVFEGTATGEDLSIDEDSYVVLSFQFDKTKNTTLFEMSGVDELLNITTRKLAYTARDKTLKYTVTKGDVVVSDSVILSDIISERCWFVATLCPLFADNGNYTTLKLVESIAEDGLFPSEDLCPSDDLYPYFGKWDKLRKG